MSGVPERSCRERKGSKIPFPLVRAAPVPVSAAWGSPAGRHLWEARALPREAGGNGASASFHVWSLSQPAAVRTCFLGSIHPPVLGPEWELLRVCVFTSLLLSSL